MPYWVQLLNALSSPFLAVFAAAALWQLVQASKALRLSREQLDVAQSDIEQRRQSERIRLAVDMCLRFADQVLPLIDAASTGFPSSAIPVCEPGLDPFSIRSYSEVRGLGWTKRPKVQRVAHALNAIEAVAIPFVIGAADSGAAVASIGVTYVETLERFGYVVARMLEEKPGAFPSARALYWRWREQLF